MGSNFLFTLSRKKLPIKLYISLSCEICQQDPALYADAQFHLLSSVYLKITPLHSGQADVAARIFHNLW